MYTSLHRIHIRIFSFILSLILSAITLLFSGWSHNVGQAGLPQLAGSSAFNTSVTEHRVIAGGQLIQYRSTAGYLSVDSAQLFYSAYTTTNNGVQRPLTFVFNGGPGSASVWLHFGALGPAIARQGGPGYINNPDTWLDFTDLVFIDPVGTGYSRAIDGVPAQQFYGFHQDVRVIADFIRRYLILNHRQQSSLFLAGESYGGARAVGLAAYLQDSLQVRVDGLTLISPALDYRLVGFGKGNDTAYPYYLPAFALAAKYHHRLAPELQTLDDRQLFARANYFAEGSYRSFLQGGGALSEMLADTLSQLTGLSRIIIKQHKGRISDQLFSHFLLRDKKKRTGIYDSRSTGTGQGTDPAEGALRASYFPAFQQYLNQELHYQNQLQYQATIAIPGWDYGGKYLNVVGTLKDLLREYPKLRVQMLSGDYDLATPPATVVASLCELNRAGIGKSQLVWRRYAAGHMLYTDNAVRSQLSSDSRYFYRQAEFVRQRLFAYKKQPNTLKTITAQGFVQKPISLITTNNNSIYYYLKNTFMSTFQKLKNLIADAENDAIAFHQKGNKAAGIRLRKAYLEIKNTAQVGRTEVTELKNAPKSS